MPYINKGSRKRLEADLNHLITNLNMYSFDEGELNYVISRMLNASFQVRRKYSEANKLIGILECVKQEFYRKQVVPYEEEKIKENGDI